MNKLFTEFENENSMRSYPFASGCTCIDTKGVSIDPGIFIDAALYPVNPTGDLYLSRIEPGGVVSISDDRSVVMTATSVRGSSRLDFYDTSGLRRHVGTMIASSSDRLAALLNVYTRRIFASSETKFASSCVFPIVNDGVLSIDVGGTGHVDGDASFSNTPFDDIRVSTDATGGTLRFDVIPQVAPVELSSIKHVYCIVDGRTPFRILKLPYGTQDLGPGNTVEVYLDGIDKQSICGNAHREDSLEMEDRCDCDTTPCEPDVDPPEPIPEAYQVEVVDMDNGAENAFYLAVPNMLGYDNPLSITMQDGIAIPKVDMPDADDIEDVVMDDITSKAVKLQVPGLERVK